MRACIHPCTPLHALKGAYLRPRELVAARLQRRRQRSRRSHHALPRRLLLPPPLLRRRPRGRQVLRVSRARRRTVKLPAGEAHRKTDARAHARLRRAQTHVRAHGPRPCSRTCCSFPSSWLAASSPSPSSTSSPASSSRPSLAAARAARNSALTFDRSSLSAAWASSSALRQLPGCAVHAPGHQSSERDARQSCLQAIASDRSG